MIRRLLLLSLLAPVLGAVEPVSSARADACYTQTVVQLVAGVPQANTVTVCGGTTTTSGGGDIVLPPPRHSGLDAICVATALSLGKNIYDFCLPPTGATTTDTSITPGIVETAFKKIPLPPSKLFVQPPNGRTLVNFATNFYTDNAPFDVPAFKLLGHSIELHVTPAKWKWRFGDGSSQSTTEPGSAYPRLDITHKYLSKGTVRPAVNTTYVAQYRVDGGPWLDVPGDAKVPGPPASLDVLEASPVLVGYGS